MTGYIVLSIQEFDKLGKSAQAEYCKKRKAEALKAWKCEDCGDKLPKSGYVWKSRFDKFIMRFRFENCTPGLRCDVCVEFPNNEFF